MSREDEIRQLIVNHSRRLQILKEQQASFGSLHTPAHILTEIEDTEAAIEELETELKAVTDNSIDRETPDVQSVLTEDINKTKRVQIIQQGDFSSLPTDRWHAAIDAFAAVIGISSQEIEVYRVYEGSIVFELGIPSNATQHLRSLLQSNSAKLHLLKIESVALEKESGEIEEWIIKERKFQLVNPPQPTTSTGDNEKAQKTILSKGQMNTGWLSNLPNWVMGAIALVTTIIGFVALILSNVRLGVTVTVVVTLMALLALSTYVITSKTKSQTVGGMTIFSFSQLRYLGFLGIAFVVLAIILLLANRTTRSFALVAFTGTATPTSTPTTAPTATFTPTGAPTHTSVPPTNTPIPSTATPTLTPTPESFSYIVKIADKSTGQDISAAEVAVEVSGYAPVSSITDSEGIARIPINSILSGQPAILVIEAEGYIVHSKHIDLIQGMLPGLVMLVPLKAQEECIPWIEADDHLNEVNCVFGDVVSTYDTENAFFVNFSPDKTSFYAVSFEHRWDNLDGRCIKLHGFIEKYEGRPQLIIRRQSQVEFCN